MMISKYLWYVLRVVLLAFVYASLAGLSQLTIVSGDAATLIWPSAGIAVAVIYLYGYKFWPGIVLGVLLHSAADGRPLLTTSAMAAVGSTLAAVITAYWLKRLRIDRKLCHVRDVTKFLLAVVLLAPTISATIGVTGLVTGHIITLDQYLYTWVTWWVGDALGVLIFTPLVLLWDKDSIVGLVRHPERVSLNAVVAFSSIIALSMIVFGILPISPEGINPYKYLILPVLPIIALYFGQRGSVTALAITMTLAITFTVVRFSPGQSYYLTLGILQQAVAMLSVSFLYIAAAITQRDERQRMLVRQAAEADKKRAYFQQLSDAKDEFISIASHQLRTPATGVKMHLGMLQTGMLGELNAEQKNSVRVASDTNERLIMTIEELLTTAEVDAGGMTLNKERVDVKELLQSIVENLHSVVVGREQNVELTYDAGTYVKNIDPKKFTIAVENLIENASKYSHPGTTIHVGIAKKSGKLMVTVEDEGVGIVNKDMDKLFDKFTRIPNELTSTRSGNGLGLYLVKQIITAHGGTINVKSKIGVGTTFTIRI